MTKRLGQYFLVNKRKIKRFSDALELKDGDVIIEIGPGRGAITKSLKCEGGDVKVIAIEKDPKLAQQLSEKFEIPLLRQGFGEQVNSKFSIITGDALKILPSLTYNLKPRKYKLVGNLPFYITGRFLRVLGELEHKPETAVLGLQKEVAERLVAVPPRMNLLAATVQFWSEPKIIANISREDFRPQPEVDAAIVRLRIRNYESGIMDDYYKLTKMLFRQPRKTILNNLLAGGKSRKKIISALRKTSIDPNDRPQNLDITEIKKLADIL